MSGSPADQLCIREMGCNFAELCVRLNISNHFNITDHEWIAAHAIEEYKYKERKIAEDRDRELAELLQNQLVIDSRRRSKRSTNPYPIRNWFSNSTGTTVQLAPARRYNLRSRVNEIVSRSRLN